MYLAIRLELPCLGFTSSTSDEDKTCTRTCVYAGGGGGSDLFCAHSCNACTLYLCNYVHCIKSLVISLYKFSKFILCIHVQ